MQIQALATEEGFASIVSRQADEMVLADEETKGARKRLGQGVIIEVDLIGVEAKGSKNWKRLSRKLRRILRDTLLRGALINIVDNSSQKDDAETSDPVLRWGDRLGNSGAHISFLSYNTEKV